MKRTLLFVLALAVIPVGVDAQGTASVSCADIWDSELSRANPANIASPLEDLRTCAQQGDLGGTRQMDFQYTLGVRYANGEGVPEDDAEAVRWYRLAAEPPSGLTRQDQQEVVADDTVGKPD